MPWQPDHLPCLQPPGQCLFHHLLSHPGVAIGIQQTTGGRQHRPLAIAFNRPSLKNQPWTQGTDFKVRRNPPRSHGIKVPWWIFSSPRIVVPVDDHLSSGSWCPGPPIQKNRAMISTPRIVDRDFKKFRGKATALSGAGDIDEDLRRFPDTRSTRQNPHRFKFRHHCHKFRKRGRNTFKDTRPRIGIHRPGSPRGRMRLPFGRPAIVLE